MSTKQITRIALFSALALVLRMSFSHLPNIQPITALFLIYSLVYGFYESILVMSVCMLVTSFLLGFGPWVFWQITSFALIIFLWKVLFYPLTRGLKKYRLVLQALLAGLCGLFYGIVIDSCFAYLYSMPWWSYVLAGMSFNIAHACATLLFYPILLSIFRRLTHEKLI
ncbi:ECF transporter S component [Streptococcus didelphis]|uniref:ECF transporter S component n=1 Tax=Streptococcus didelphis TaxID=102886 RepID=UPI0003697982|nr:ECF transporter S component [Streptococcus didelphis]